MARIQPNPQVFCDAHVFPNPDGSARLFLVSSNVHDGHGFVQMDVAVVGDPAAYTDIHMMNAEVLANDLLLAYQVGKSADSADARIYVHTDSGETREHTLYMGHIMEWCARRQREAVSA